MSGVLPIVEIENACARAFWWETGVEWFDASPISRRGIIAIAERLYDEMPYDARAIAKAAITEWLAP